MGRCRFMMWGSFGCVVFMLMIVILLSFVDKGTLLVYVTSSVSVVFFFLVSIIYYGLIFVSYCSFVNIGILCYSICLFLVRLVIVFYGRMFWKFYFCMLGLKVLLLEFL